MLHFSDDYCYINTCAQIVSIIHQVQQTDRENKLSIKKANSI